jgi:hypothetical protein
MLPSIMNPSLISFESSDPSDIALASHNKQDAAASEGYVITEGSLNSREQGPTCTAMV